MINSDSEYKSLLSIDENNGIEINEIINTNSCLQLKSFAYNHCLIRNWMIII